MNAESSSKQTHLADQDAVQDAVGPDEEIASAGSLTTEIETVIDGTGSLHQHDYVVGEVADYGLSGDENVHFELVHRKEGGRTRKTTGSTAYSSRTGDRVSLSASEKGNESPSLAMSRFTHHEAAARSSSRRPAPSERTTHSGSGLSLRIAGYRSLSPRGCCSSRSLSCLSY